MIDTIRLAITYDTRPTWLNRLVLSSSFDLSTGTIKSISNPSSVSKKLGVYLPRVTYQSRPTTGQRRHDLLIELSLPKMLFGNNFNELTDTDFERLSGVITDTLNRIGVPVTHEQIITSEVRKIDFSKNIIFKDYTSVSSIAADLQTADTSRRYDSQRTDFRNGGHIYHMKHSNSLDVSMYDKVADLQQGKISDKRAREKDNYLQSTLLDVFSVKKNLSVARFEVRISGKAKINQELMRSGVGPLTELNFENIYQSKIARAVLLHYWQENIDSIPKIPLDYDTPERLLSEILKSDKITPQLAFAQLGYTLSIKGNESRSIRNLIDQRFGRHAWNRLKTMRAPPKKTRLKNLAIITSAIDTMETVDINKHNF